LFARFEKRYWKNLIQELLDFHLKGSITEQKCKNNIPGRKNVKAVDDYTDLVRKFNSEQITR